MTNPSRPSVATADVVVAVDKLNFTYPGGVRALREVSFTLCCGRRIGILGPNGAGKSTLLLYLSGLLPSTPATSGLRPAVSGEHALPPTPVTIAGLPLTSRNLPRIRQQVGLVFQNPDDQLFCPTVFDDVAFGPRNMGLPVDEVRRRVIESLAQVGLPADFIEPPPTDSPAAAAAATPLPGPLPLSARNPLRLSLGQKKRVALATVLSMRPAVIALDEPTSNLDPRGRSEIIRLLMELACTQIIVTHDLALVREICHEALVMSRGRVLIAGPAPAVLDDTATLRQAGLVE